MTQALALIPASIRHLWQDAMDFIADLVEQADRDVLRAGIRRAAGAQLAIWIGGAESALRRLILIAARMLTPSPLKPPIKQPVTQTPRTGAKPARSFSVFRLHGSGTPSHRRPLHVPCEPAPYGHIRFPADPILALGRVALRPKHLHNGGPILPRTRAKNPLDRRGRLSRNDPDWRPPPERPFVEKPDRETEPDYRDLYGYEIVHRLPRAKPKRIDSRPDWRRCYDEWEKPVPAPTFIARLDALARAIANPDALIRRTARRLQSQRDRILALARAARPATRLPRRTRRFRIDEGACDMASATHDAFDTS